MTDEPSAGVTAPRRPSADDVSRPAMLIDGEAVRAERWFQVVDPATGTAFAEAPLCEPAQVDEAFAAATRAFATWRTDEAARRDALRAAADAIVAAVGRLAPLITREQGKPLTEASLEVMGAAQWFRYFAEHPITHEVIRDNRSVTIDVSRRPIGVLAAITPSNYPLLLAAWKLAPALLVGNTAVLKPSPFCPLTALHVAAILADVFPPGVVNVVSGPAGVGRQMVQHPAARKVSFTGSLAAGRAVAEMAAHDLKRVTLELGGNDAAIVLDDADPEEVASNLFWGAFHNNGQVCAAIKRVFVPEPLVDEMAEALAAEARSARVGSGLDPDTVLGPVGNRPAFERLGRLVDEATGRGATVRCGEAPTGTGGYFFPPTILTGVDDDAAVVAEEQYGPALPVLGYATVDEAVARANATPYGLSGSVWSEDHDHAASVAARLECGTAWVNTHLVLLPGQPFGGRKLSGLGVENGRWGLDSFADLQVIHHARNAF